MIGFISSITGGDRDVTEEEWLDGLRHLSNDQIIQAHFRLQEQIKKHYKLRSEPRNLKKAIALCEQQIALAPLAVEAMAAKHKDSVVEYQKITGRQHPSPEFHAPAHHGYRQYSMILRRNKDFAKLEDIEAKRKYEGWAD